MRLSADFMLGVGAMALAAGYWGLAADIPDSLLSDAVGARGFPAILAAGLAGTGALLAVRDLVASRSPTADEVASPASPVDGWSAFNAAAVVLLLAGYILVLPLVGYAAGLALLIGTTAAFAGARGTVSIAITSAAAGVLFWLTFAKLLGIAMPLGRLFGGA